ncbi:ExeM/NucH family extracellular endonuclease [Marinobacter halodurans]|uniref:ExeM/NucH family extracellular endonuclease n=1 Tax=Marinobacter halodurans TaxID=2528979 RepID=A0ABY1ZKH4_9GAMM|nr:ExeM/NucH family extracellular endonuclease [Marinobacter halodurans]TBW53779.1 ExeM/NucH family extracellular endonuclease [Marinobacter halodurans]
MKGTAVILALLGGVLLSGPALADRCGDRSTPLSKVQGGGQASPLAGHRVDVEGVITLDGRGPEGLGGFYLQALPGHADSDPTTSDAVFVYTRASGGAVGQHVRVSGRVKEYHGLTEIAAGSEVRVCGRSGLPEPVVLSFPLPADPEALEGMRTRFADPVTVVDTHDLGRFGVVTLAADDPRYPDSLAPQDRILLDDRRLDQNPADLPLPRPGLAADHSLRAGSLLAPVQGVLDYRYDRWRLQPDRWSTVVGGNDRPARPEAPADNTLRVASFNLLNFFNGDGRGQGFPTARGADSAAELERQRQKLASAIEGLRADIVGVMELENDGHGPESAAADLVAALGHDWASVRPQEAGDDAIRVGLLYRADRVEPVGESASLDESPFNTYSRVPLAQTFRMLDGGGTLRVVVNHFKSRSCRHARGANADQHDGEGCYAPVRARSARVLRAWLADLPSRDTLVLGDLNSHASDTPLQILADAGFRRPSVLAGDDGYSYRFHGVRGTLDYILPDPSLRARVVGGAVWHINADEPPVLDYNLEYHPDGRAVRLYGPGPWRSSDHDPVYLDLRLGAD